MPAEPRAERWDVPLSSRLSTLERLLAFRRSLPIVLSPSPARGPSREHDSHGVAAQ